MAAYSFVNGVEVGELAANNVQIALVKVTRAHEDSAKKKQGGQLLELTLEREIFGKKLSAAALSKVPFSNPISNSAWPRVQGEVEGRYFLMCWIANWPCGLGQGVYLGGDEDLPLLVSGPDDSQIDALVDFLDIIELTDKKARTHALRGAFLSSDVLLSRMADAGMRHSDLKHVNSPARYERLAQLLAQSNGDEGSYSIISALRDMKPISGPNEYKKWKAPYASKSKGGFDQFRSRLVASLWSEGIAKRGNPKEVRRSTMALMTQSPFFLGRARDAIDTKIIKSLSILVEDPIVEIRRTAIHSLLTIVKKLRQRWPSKGKEIRRLVKNAYERESDPEEKAILARRFQAILGWRM